MSFISSIILRSVTVTSNKMDFTRPDIDVTKVAVKFKLRNELEEDKDSKSCKLTFSSDVIGKLTDGEGDDPDLIWLITSLVFHLQWSMSLRLKIMKILFG